VVLGFKVMFNCVLLDAFGIHGLPWQIEIRAIQPHCLLASLLLISGPNPFDGVAQPTVKGFTGLVWAPEVRYNTCDPDYARRVQVMLLGAQAQFNAWQHGDVPWICTEPKDSATQTYYWDMFTRYGAHFQDTEFRWDEVAASVSSTNAGG
jgi:hypothetical protein